MIIRNDITGLKNFILFIILLGSLLLSAQTDHKINKIIFSGNKTFPDKILLEQIAEEPVDKLFFWKKREIFNRILMEIDIERLKTFYQTEGFLNVDIETKIWKNEKKNYIDLEFIIRENEPVIITEIDYEIPLNTEEVTGLISDPELEMNLILNSRFRDENLFLTHKKISKILIDNGYPLQKTNYDLNVDKSRNSVTVNFSIYSGGYHKFGDVEIINGNPSLNKYIKRETAFSHNDTFDHSRLQITQQQIMNLGVFRYVTVKALLDSITGMSIPVKIITREAPQYNLKIGFGYGLVERLRTSAEVERIGFFRSIDKLNLYLKYSRLEPYHINLKLIQPVFFDHRNKLVTSVFLKKQKASAYTIRRYGSNIKLDRRLSESSSAFIGYTIEQNFLKIKESTMNDEDVQDITDYNKSNFLLGVNFDSSEPVISPHKGFSVSLKTTLAGIGFNSDFHYYQWLIEGKKFFGITKDLVIAIRLKLGIMEPIRGDRITPLEERFYAGGSNSIRGWAHARISPQSDDGELMGGNSYQENSLELRFPIWNILSGVIFSDFGNVWKEPYYVRLNDLKYAVGTGLRIKTPIGPVRVDGAVSEDKDYQFFVSLGQAF